MKLRRALNKLTREQVFSTYSRVIIDYKDYEAVDMKQMINEIISFYLQPDNLKAVLFQREIEFLKYMLSGEYDRDVEIWKKTFKTGFRYRTNAIDEVSFWEIQQLADKLLIIRGNDRYSIADEFKPILESIVKESKANGEDIDYRVSALAGLLKMHGILKVDDLIDKGCKLLNSDRDIMSRILNLSQFRFYAYVFEHEDELYAIYSPYIGILDVDDIRKWQLKDNIVLSDLFDLFFIGINISNKEVRTFFEEAGKFPQRNSLLEVVDKCRILGMDEQLLDKTVSEYLDNAIYLDGLIDKLNAAYPHLS